MEVVMLSLDERDERERREMTEGTESVMIGVNRMTPRYDIDDYMNELTTMGRMYLRQHQSVVSK